MELAEKYVKKMKIDLNKERLNLNELAKGIEVEMEHKKIVHGDYLKSGEIAMDHLREDSHYYSKLKRLNSPNEGAANDKYIFDLYKSNNEPVDDYSNQIIHVLEGTWHWK